MVLKWQAHRLSRYCIKYPDISSSVHLVLEICVIGLIVWILVWVSRYQNKNRHSHARPHFEILAEVGVWILAEMSGCWKMFLDIGPGIWILIQVSRLI